MKVIEVENLTKRFGTFTAVDNISFSVEKGEIFGFLGANGAGKTTAMRMLCGLLVPTSGKGVVAGYDIQHQSEKVKASIGYMSQKFALYEDLKVWENIRLYAGIYGVPEKETKERTDMLLAELGFEKEKESLVKSLPLGWRQFWEMIYKASERGITVFVTTHYMDEAEYCNRVSIMVDGRIDALDSPSALRREFAAASMDEVFRHLARKSKNNGL